MIQKKQRSLIAAPVAIVLLLLLSTSITIAAERKAITKDLIQLLEKNPDLKSMLETSIEKAKKINPDKKTNPAQNLDQYLDFIDRAVELIPRDVIENPKSLTRDNIYQSICYFYFPVDQPLDELKDKGLYKNAIQYYPPFSEWLLKFADAWGQFLDTEESWDMNSYYEFCKDPRYNLYRDWYEPACNWNTFNRFFSRYLKCPEMHPISSPADPSVVVSPADSVPQGMWEIDKDSKIKVDGGITVKNVTYYSVNELLGEGSAYEDEFANGVLTHTFLNVFDYHRYHFAVGGTILEKKIIQQNVALEVSWDSKHNKYEAIDSTGWQFTQTRGYVIMDTEKYGLVALMPMGMAQVSSVNFEDDVNYGTIHKKGDMLGTFLFGGSDFIILFQDKAGFELTAPKDPSDKTGTTYLHILMGEEYGRMKGQTK